MNASAPIFKVDMNNPPTTAREAFEGVASSLDVMVALLTQDSNRAPRGVGGAEKIAAGLIFALCLQLDRMGEKADE